MAIFVLVTDKCREDARNHGLTDEVDRFASRVEATQSTSLFDPFPPPYLVKKKLGGRQGRLIADRRAVGDHAVIVFLAILIRGSRDYEDGFAKDPRAYGEQKFRGLVTENHVQKLVASRTSGDAPTRRQDPSPAEFGLLYSAFSHHHGRGTDDLICETRDWVKQVTTEKVSKQLVRLAKACIAAIDRPAGLHFIEVQEKAGWGVWTFRADNRVVFISVATDSDGHEAEVRARALEPKLKHMNASQILQISQRAYPALILADEDLWIDLEREPIANMALSPEESAVLESARHADHPFPLFINGRAGSGKSTILQYLFADLLFYSTSNIDPAAYPPPIYLTANGELLRTARAFVERLLRSEAVFSEQRGAGDGLGSKILFDSAFQEFQPFLLSLLPPKDRLTRFAKSSRVDYARFRRLWTDRFGQDQKACREFGPDISWHVIRSYIKGMSSETFLEPSDYAHLPDNQLTVTEQAFGLVHERVWTNWYQRYLAEKGLWDDQDLSRDLLENDRVRPLYSAVFCDEAQDFTRIDLELLLRLNLFSDRTIPPADVCRVPFAFAGDQFQTLNPTGFRWDAIKASFVEKFIYEMDPARRSGRADLNYHELQFNYRSTEKIVRFGNHVQALRAGLFQLPDLQPQTPWGVEPNSFPVVWFSRDNAGFWKKFQEVASFVLIVPCHEGEESEFVRNDPVLRERIRFEGDVPLNVLSASRAKGCEYAAVVVYGFGDSLPEELAELIAVNCDLESLGRDQTLPLEYFINRLYVAVSRAKRRLVVVDSDDGFRKLWRVAQDQTAEAALVHTIKHGAEVWARAIEGMAIGDADDLSLESVGDPLENAKAFESDGIARQDSFLLKQAAQVYRSANDLAKARECWARALDLEQKWLEAGDAWIEAGFVVPEALRCYWRQGRKGWQRVIDKAGQCPQFVREIEYQVAHAVCGSEKPSKASEVIRLLTKRLEVEEFALECAGTAVWSDAVTELLKLANGSSSPASSEGYWGQLAADLDRMLARGMALPAAVRAETLFRARRYSDSIAAWDETKERPSMYLQARAAVEPYPERLHSLSRLHLPGEIVSAYYEQPEVKLSPEQITIVLDALVGAGQSQKAIDLARKEGFGDGLLSLALSLSSSQEEALARECLHMGVQLLIQKGRWEPIIELLSTGALMPSEAWKARSAQEWLAIELPLLQHSIVRILARSRDISSAAAPVQRATSAFLSKHIVQQDDWREYLSVEEAGAALERAGRISDAVGFYERLTESEDEDDAIKDVARRRWLVCKKRQLNHERMRGSKKKIDIIAAQVFSKARSWKIGESEDIPEFPELREIATIVPAKLATRADEPVVVAEIGTERSPAPETSPSTKLTDVRIVLGPFDIVASRAKRRCNITHKETMETGFVKLGEDRCGGEVEFSPQGASTWFVAAWGMSLEIKGREGGRLAIGLIELGLMVTIEF